MRTIYKKIRLKIIQQWKELKSRFRLRSCHAWFVFHYINNVMQSITYKESLLEKYPNTEFFWSVFSRIQSKYGKIRTRKNSLFWHFSRKELEGSILCSIGLPKFKYSSFSFFHRLRNSFTYLKIWLHVEQFTNGWEKLNKLF